MASQTATSCKSNWLAPSGRRSRAAAGERVIVVGAGSGGLSAAINLAVSGIPVLVVEKAPGPGGKIRQVDVAGRAIDAGPTVLTMRWVFERIFAEAGSALDDALTTRRLGVICRHAWADGSRLDLFADADRSAAAIADFAGPVEADRFRRFAATAATLHDALLPAFIDASKPGPVELAARMARADPGSLLAVNPFAALWQSLTASFGDPRLRQLFARYATYCGASPFQASATLMLIAHAEALGVWTVDGGLGALAVALDDLAGRVGVERRYSCEVAGLEADAAGVSAVRLCDGGRLEAAAVILNADCAALAEGLFGRTAQRAIPAASPDRSLSARSLSAMATALVGTPAGFPLEHHNVFFSRDYRAEFDDIFTRDRLPTEPTVYLCAQDRGGTSLPSPPASALDDAARSGQAPNSVEAPHSDEAMLVLVNAPANGDRRPYDEREIEACWERTLRVMERCGLAFADPPPTRTTATPRTFNTLFPATGGALYGQASHGWAAAFRRPGSRTAIPGLYLAGGSVHPGPGVPMAALSGRQAAASLLADRASIRRFHPVAISGGISTR